VKQVYVLRGTKALFVRLAQKEPVEVGETVALLVLPTQLFNCKLLFLVWDCLSFGVFRPLPA